MPIVECHGPNWRILREVVIDMEHYRLPDQSVMERLDLAWKLYDQTRRFFQRDLERQQKEGGPKKSCDFSLNEFVLGATIAFDKVVRNLGGELYVLYGMNKWQHAGVGFVVILPDRRVRTYHIGLPFRPDRDWPYDLAPLLEFAETAS